MEEVKPQEGVQEESEIDKAKKLIDQDKATRISQCAIELKQLLEKYNCEIVSLINLNAK